MANWKGAGSGAAAGAAAGSVAGPWGTAVGGVVGGAMGLLSGDQASEQGKLTDQQVNANKDLLNYSYGLQKNMYDYTYDKNTPQAQIKNLKEAGLNPALMYGLGGNSGGDTGGGSASAGGATASGSAERQAADNQTAMMTLQAAKLNSEIKVNESIANSNNADAKNKGAGTETLNATRELLKENMKQEGLGRFLQNLITDSTMNQSKDNPDGQNSEIHNNTYEWTGRITGNSYVMEGVAAAITKTQAEAGDAAAKALLSNKKAEGYFQELMNETLKAKAAGKMADNDEVKAAAIKLASEWSTGEFTNWKTWTDLAGKGIEALSDVIGTISPKGLIKSAIK